MQIYFALTLVFTLSVLHGTVAEGSGEGSSGSLSCYVCNSEYDSECKSPIGHLQAQVCPSKNPELGDDFEEHAKGCRKIEQEVNDKVRIIRQCAYGGTDMKGVKRTGNKGVRLFYWQCSSNECNSAPVRTSSAILACVVPLIVFVLLRF